MLLWIWGMVTVFSLRSPPREAGGLAPAALGAAGMLLSVALKAFFIAEGPPSMVSLHFLTLNLEKLSAFSLRVTGSTFYLFKSAIC
jgi:hypothetical protein